MEDRLYKFARLIEKGSFTAAAESLHISQPALTTAIQKLERELKTELIIRSNRSFKITPAGELAYQTAKHLATEAQNLKTKLAEANSHTVSLNFGLIDGMAELLFVQGRSLHDLEPSTQLSVVVDNTTRLVSYVARNELDVALIAKAKELPASLEATVIGQEPFVVVAHRDLAKHARASAGAGQVDSFLSYNLQSHTQELIYDYFADHGVRVKPIFYSTSPEILLSLVLAKEGVAALPYVLVRPYLEKGLLEAIAAGNGSLLTRTIVAVQRSGRHLPTPAVALLQTASQQLQAIRHDATLAVTMA